MGKGSKSPSIKVSKEITRPSEIKSEVQKEGSEVKISEGCLFTVTDQITLEKELPGVNNNSKVSFIPSFTDPYSIDIYIDGIKAGPYAGPLRQKILRCINEGYIYNGKVDSIKKRDGTIEIEYSVLGSKGR